MRNKITDLNNHLFEQLERLNSNDLKGEALQEEIERAKAITGIANNIVGAAKVTVDAMKLVSKGEFNKDNLPTIFSDQKQLNGKEQ